MGPGPGLREGIPRNGSVGRSPVKQRQSCMQRLFLPEWWCGYAARHVGAHAAAASQAMYNGEPWHATGWTRFRFQVETGPYPARTGGTCGHVALRSAFCQEAPCRFRPLANERFLCKTRRMPCRRDVLVVSFDCSRMGWGRSQGRRQWQHRARRQGTWRCITSGGTGAAGWTTHGCYVRGATRIRLRTASPGRARRTSARTHATRR